MPASTQHLLQHRWFPVHTISSDQFDIIYVLVGEERLDAAPIQIS